MLRSPHVMHFGELDFDVRAILTPTGRIKWVETGMPRLHPNLNKLAAFLYGIDSKTLKPAKGPVGTGFIITYGTDRTVHSYLVSNYHVSINCACFHFSMFDLRSSIHHFDIDVDEWRFNPNGDDLAIIDVTEIMSKEAVNSIASIQRESILTEEFIREAQIDIGDDVFMIGLLAGHTNGEPVGRFGNIAAIPNPRSPVEQGHGKWRPSFLVDMRSRGGHSGSPVNVYRTPSADLSSELFRDISEPRRLPYPGASLYNRFVGLLGIHCAQFNEFGKVMKDARGEPIYEGDRLSLPSGMTVVVPGARILEALEWPEFRTRRQAREAHMAEIPRESRTTPEWAQATSDAAPAETVQPDPAANPDHREDFNRLVSEAAKKRPQAD